MSAQRGLSPARKIVIYYVLMLLTLCLGFSFLIALLGSYRALNHTQEVWIRSHQLWIWRSCMAFLVILLLAGLLMLPLIWSPVALGFNLHDINVHSIAQQGIGMYSAVVGLIIAMVGVFWLVYRSAKGLHYLIKGKVIY